MLSSRGAMEYFLFLLPLSILFAGMEIVQEWVVADVSACVDVQGTVSFA